MENIPKKNKMYCYLSYIYIFWIVGLLSERKDSTVRFHVNQGITLSIFVTFAMLILIVVCRVLLSISKVFAIITSLLKLLFLFTIVAYIGIGLYNVKKGQKKCLPIIGGLCDFLK